MKSRIWLKHTAAAKIELRTVGLRTGPTSVEIIGQPVKGKAIQIGTYDYNERSEAEDRIEAIREGRDSEYHIAVKKAAREIFTDKNKWINACQAQGGYSIQQVGRGSNRAPHLVATKYEGGTTTIGWWDGDEEEGWLGSQPPKTGSKKASVDQIKLTCMDLMNQAVQLKAQTELLKGKNNPEIEKALDDATAAQDIFIHHMLDIYGE